jgi:two-component system cell cycle response regulator DivK
MNNTVMIVEDDVLNMKLLNDLLTIKGYDIIQHTDGFGAYDAICNHRPDLILMDINLPGQSGLDITAALKMNEELKHIPVIAVTAYAHQEDMNLCLKSGCDGFIAKPISVNTFYKTVSDFIDHSKPNMRIVH